jgi:hypothetical protein
MSSGMDATSGYAPALSRSPARPAPRRERSWTCRVVPQGGPRYALLLSGSLHPGWAGRLAAGLAARHISVVRATARRASTAWAAEIELDVLDPSLEPSAIDFIALMAAHETDRGPAPDVRLASYRLERTRRDVEIEIRAEDSVGFLGRVLRVFASFGLFPHEMEVETLGSEVRDVFRLQSAAGQAPPEGIVAALERRLEGLVDAK